MTDSSAQGTKTDNELIAEFMEVPKSGYERGDDLDPRYKKGDFVQTGWNGFHESELKYHESWDWLMPVVEKIHESKKYMGHVGFERGVDINIYSPHVCISFPDTSAGYDYVNGEWENENLFDSRHYNDPTKPFIERVYRAVVSYIKWYNSHGK